MKIRTTALVCVLAAALAGSAVAASLALQPSALVLRKGDFPAKATYNWGQMPANFTQALAGLGVKASGAYIAVTIPRGGPANYQTVAGFVVTTASAAQARTAYTAFKEDLPRRGRTVLRLPANGDEQFALYTPSVSKAELLVRRNRVVWQLEVTGGGLPKPAQTAELQKYAAKQKARVRAG
jgi:hypothetical protein